MRKPLTLILSLIILIAIIPVPHVNAETNTDTQSTGTGSVQNQTQTATDAATQSAKKTIKKLTKGKRYQIKVRAYKKVGSTTYYGAWSKVKTTAKIK